MAKNAPTYRLNQGQRASESFIPASFVLDSFWVLLYNIDDDKTNFFGGRHHGHTYRPPTAQNKIYL